MRALCLAVALAFTAALGGCVPDTEWPKLAKCGAPVAGELYPTISQLLLQETSLDDAVKALEDVAIDYSPSVVACVVKFFVDQWTRPGASQDPAKLAAAARGQQFLELKGVQVE